MAPQTPTTTSGFSVSSTARRTFAVLCSVRAASGWVIATDRLIFSLYRLLAHRSLEQHVWSSRYHLYYRHDLGACLHLVRPSLRSIWPLWSGPATYAMTPIAGRVALTAAGTCSLLVSFSVLVSVSCVTIEPSGTKLTKDSLSGPKSATVPVFAAETAPPLIRGALVMQCVPCLPV